MFKAARWRSDKNKDKIVFKLQLQAAQVPLPGSEAVTVSLVPLDVGKPTVRSERVSAVGGTCNWLNPIYETVKLRRDPKSGKINEKLYKFLVSTAGSDRAGLLGEATVNLADYAEAFKASSISLPLKAGALLHVTIQRMQADAGGRSFRENEQNGYATLKPEGRTLKSQLGECDSEEGAKSFSGRNDTNLLKVRDGLHINRETRLKLQSSRNLPTYADSGSKLNESHGFDVISIATSDSSSDIYTPRDNNSFTNGGIQKNSTMLLSPVANNGIGLKSITGSGDWSGTSAPDRSTDGSTNSSGESGLTGVQCSDDTIERIRGDVVFLTRKVEISEVELQTLRKQIVKENRRGQDLWREISNLKEERDALRRECQELKLAQKKANESQIDTKDPSCILEEIKQELDYERNLNSSLHLQLQKTQEANSELLLAVRDLDDLLAHRNGEATPYQKCSKMDVKATDNKNLLGNEHQQLQQFECKQELLGKTFKSDESQYPLGVLVNEHNRMSVAYSLEKKIIDLNSEIELYKKGREDLEMQMEQLALDYEILKQENHDVSSKLEQTQLREQLRMQYECSTHSAIIAELEAHVESLEREIQTQGESFESNIDIIMRNKIEQEKKFLQVEESLRKTKWNNLSITEQLQEKFETLSSQVSSVFYDNEKIVKQALKEASELRLQRSHLERTLEKTKENLASLQNKYSMTVRHLLGILNFKSKETDKLQLELKRKNEELQSYKKIQEARLKNSSEKMQLLQTEIEKSKMETCLIFEQKEKLVDEIRNLETTNQGNELILQQISSENRVLKQEKSLLKQEVKKSLEEISCLRIMRNETGTIISTLNVEVETIGMQCNDLKRSLSEGEPEKEILRRLVSDLTGGLLEEGPATRAEEELNNSYINEDKHSRKSCKGGRTSEFQIDVDILHPRVGVEVEINDTESRGQEFDRRYSQANSEKQQHIVTCACDQHKVAEISSAMAVLKEQNESMEADLKEMQERYSEISLKFAEVEGERQQLVMTIRTLKNALKS